jgi:hypothetical protein
MRGERPSGGPVNVCLPRSSVYREITQQRAQEFFDRGYPSRYFFPHRVYHLPKCGPDGFLLADRMCGCRDPNQLWEIVLYATGPVVDELPPGLFFDDEIIWHQQQFGRTGQVATASLVVDGARLYSITHVSDLVQRISRRRQHKTKVEKKFGGWNHMLLNGVLGFALERQLGQVFLASADLVMRHTDPARTIERELYERVYDRNVRQQFRVSRNGPWWVADVRENLDRIVVPVQRQEAAPSDRTVCLCHDVERGWGHLDVDPWFAFAAHRASPERLARMLAVEESAEVRATYHVLGAMFAEVRSRIEERGHCLAFHSYDHRPERPGRKMRAVYRLLNVRLRWDLDQLQLCRQIDYRIKGYRPPRSEITPSLSDANLCYHNFEWLASSAGSLRTGAPKMENRLVKIPILFDDFALYKRRVPYEEWERRAIECIAQHEFVAFSLHDCYAHFWLPHYRTFLEKVKEFGTLRTLNEVANQVILENAA